MKIWQSGLRVAVAAVIFTGSLTLVEAQSSSSSYKAVDFINPSASLTESGSYRLNDSIDYYGGVNVSSSYQECSGDFAVLSGCLSAVVPPPPPPPPPGGGSTGGSGAVNWDTPTCEDTGTCPVVTPPVDEPVPPVVKKPFKLPDIYEPVTVVEPEPEEIVVEPEKVESLLAGPVKMTAEEQKQIVKRIRIAADRLTVQILKNVAPEFCADLTCTETNLFKSAGRSQTKPGQVCSIYTFGGFRFLISCQDFVLVWLAVLLAAVIFSPIGIFVFRKKKTVRVKR